MIIKYNLTKKMFCDCDNGEYVGYGISAVTNDGSCVATVDDMSVDRNAVLALVRLCNDLELDPVHLLDVAEDFLI